jgi:hypothetical protein
MTGGDILTSGGKHSERAIKWPPTLPMIHDAQVLATRVTQLLVSYSSSQPHLAEEPEINSGYRPAEINSKTPGAKPNSNHILCRAVDVADPESKLGAWCRANVALLEHNELWIEDPLHTPGWVHFQSIPPRSNHRIFVP